MKTIPLRNAMLGILLGILVGAGATMAVSVALRHHRTSSPYAFVLFRPTVGAKSGLSSCRNILGGPCHVMNRVKAGGLYRQLPDGRMTEVVNLNK